jgi:hypothetical protein
MKLSTRCQCISVQLSRRPQDLSVLLTSLRNGEQTASVGQAQGEKRERRFVEAVIRR